MTEKANPSEFRPVEAFKTAGAIAYGGHGSNGFIVDGANPTDISVQDSGITESDLNAFAESSTTSSFDVTIDGGEAFIFGSWLAIDTNTVVTLSSNANDQTIYVGWNKDGTNDVIVGLSSAFSSSTGNADKKIPLWTFDTDGSGVINSLDERLIGYSQEETTFTGSITDDKSNQVYDYVNERIGSDLVDATSIDESISAKWSSQHEFDSGIDIRDDLVDDNTVIWDSSSNEIPDSAIGSIDNSTLTNSSLTIAGNSVNLGGSSSVSINDLSDVSSNAESSGEIPIYHESNVRYENATLSTGSELSVTNSDASITISLNNNSVEVAGNPVSLGGSTTVSITDLSDVFSDTETSGQIPIWSDANSQYENASISGGNGLSINEGNASITIDIDTDGIKTDEIDQSISPTWTSEHQFNSGTSTPDDTTNFFGTGDNISVRYDSTNDDIRWKDEGTANVDRMSLDRTSGDLTISGTITESSSL